MLITMVVDLHQISGVQFIHRFHTEVETFSESVLRIDTTCFRSKQDTVFDSKQTCLFKTKLSSWYGVRFQTSDRDHMLINL